MSGCQRRSDRTLRQLHPSKEGLQLLSSGPGTRSPPASRRRIQGLSGSAIFQHFLPSSPHLYFGKQSGRVPPSLSWYSAHLHTVHVRSSQRI